MQENLTSHRRALLAKTAVRRIVTEFVVPGSIRRSTMPGVTGDYPRYAELPDPALDSLNPRWSQGASVKSC